MNPNESLLNLQDEGFLQVNSETLQLLNKAMQAGSGVDASQFTGGRAMSFESLDQTLVNILHTQEEAVLFQRLKKQPVQSAVHQWDLRTDVGSDDGAWVPEGGQSGDADQTISRQYLQAKYLQTKRTVTLQAAMTKMIEEPIALEENAGTLWLIRNVERALFTGNSSIIAAQPDGLDVSIPASNVIDARGYQASSSHFEDAITQGTRMIRDYYGKPDLLLSSTMVMQDVQVLLKDRIRFPPSEIANPGVGGPIGGGPLGGGVFNRYPTAFATPALKEDVFIKESAAPRASTLTTQRPSQPVISSIVITHSVANSLFGSGDAGTYYYLVVAVNQYGDSLASAVSAQQTLAAGDSIAITITQASDPTTVAGYKLYRGQKNGTSTTDLRYATQVVATDATAPTVITDINTYLPGCSSAYLLTTDPMYNALEWAQFLPMMKFNLYPTASAVYPFLMLLFGGLANKKPVNHVRIANISPPGLNWYNLS